MYVTWVTNSLRRSLEAKQVSSSGAQTPKIFQPRSGKPARSAVRSEAMFAGSCR